MRTEDEVGREVEQLCAHHGAHAGHVLCATIRDAEERCDWRQLMHLKRMLWRLRFRQRALGQDWAEVA